MKYLRLILLLAFLILVVTNSSASKHEDGLQTAEPITLTTILAISAISATAVSTGISMQAQRQQNKAASATAKYNAALAQRKADEERKMGLIKAEARRKQTQRLMSSQRAGYAKAGVTTAGTPLTVGLETAKNEALNALMINREGENAARGYEAEASAFNAQASNIKSAGRLAVGAELFGGIGSIASMSTDLDFTNTSTTTSTKKSSTNYSSGGGDAAHGF